MDQIIYITGSTAMYGPFFRHCFKMPQLINGWITLKLEIDYCCFFSVSMI